jgi:hypothetical protein
LLKGSAVLSLLKGSAVLTLYKATGRGFDLEKGGTRFKFVPNPS